MARGVAGTAQKIVAGKLALLGGAACHGRLNDAGFARALTRLLARRFGAGPAPLRERILAADVEQISVDTLYKLLSALGLELAVRYKPSDRGAAGTRKQEW